MTTFRVLLVNEIRLIGNVLSATLQDEPDIAVVGTCTTIEQALSLAPASDIVLVSTRMPDGGALELTRQLAQDHPNIKVLVLGLAESEAEILQYVEAGAFGYVLNDDSVDELLRNIHAAKKDEALVSPEVAGALMSRVAELAQRFEEIAAVPEAVDLTPREEEVLELIAQDLSNQEIAERLIIEVGTVKNHVHSILQKLNVNSRKDAATYWDVINTHGG